MKILYNITTTNSYLDRIESIFNTWLSNTKDYLIFSDFDIKERNIIKTSNYSDYFMVYDKLINGICYICENDFINNYDYFLFCDDDTYIFKNNLNKLLNDIIYNDFSIGYIWCGSPALNHKLNHNLYNNINMKWFSGGAGYVISKLQLLKIYNFYINFGVDEKIGVHRFSDVYISYIINKIGGKMIHNENFNYDNINFDKNTNIIDKISYHYVNCDDMIKIYNLEKRII